MSLVPSHYIFKIYTLLIIVSIVLPIIIVPSSETHYSIALHVDHKSKHTYKKFYKFERGAGIDHYHNIRKQGGNHALASIT